MSKPTLDHLVYGVPRLDIAISTMAERWGVDPLLGGQHPSWGTHNAILVLDSSSYLELIAPDPSQTRPDSLLPFGLDCLREPRLVTWAVQVSQIEKSVAQARASGFDPGSPTSMSRNLITGDCLHWKLTSPQTLGDGLIPFLIDWGSSSHPSTGAPSSCTLLSLRGEHPQPELIRRPLQALGVELSLIEASSSTLVATLRTPKGVIELR